MKRNRIINWRAVGWMLLFVAVLSSCRDDDAGTPQAKMRTISLNFPAIQPYTASRAENNVNAINGESVFHTADIWVFDSEETEENATAAAYKRIEDAERYTTIDGELRTELTIPEEIEKVDIYVITNNSAEGLDANSTRNELKAATFDSKPTNETSLKLADDGLLMSRIITAIPVDQLSGGYKANARLPLERGVAKIACFFAKESESTEVKITRITVSGATDKGNVFPEAVTYANKDTRPNSANVPTGATNIRIDIAPPSSIPTLSDGETLERGNNGTEYAQKYVDRLNDIASSTNDYYLFEADANTMKVTISYTLGTTEVKTAEVELDENVIRNHYIVITGTVKGGILELDYLALQWEKESSAIGWQATATLAAWNSSDYDSPNLKDATEGDEEAVYCYVLYPRYAQKDKSHARLETSEHEANKGETVPSYAGFYFKLDAPEGAVWKAYLTNTTNFRFGRGQYKIDPDGENERFCVSTGIAREEPYQIQITAINAWTNVNWNNTSWGTQVENEGREVFTDFYITISLDGEEEYELVINPVVEGITSYWNDGRRFAGGSDTRIRIWQLKAVQNKGFDDLINELPSNHSIKTWWNGNSDNNN